MLQRGLLGVVLLCLALAIGCREQREDRREEEIVEVSTSAEASNTAIYPFKKHGEIVEMASLSEAGRELHLRHLAEGFTPFHVEKIGGPNGEECLYVLYYAFNGECNACAPTVAAVKFEKRSTEYVLHAASLLGEYGYAGNPPAVKAVEIGKGKYGIWVEDFGMGQGIIVRSLALFWDKNGSFEMILDGLANYDDRGFYLDEENGVVADLAVEKGAGLSHSLYDLKCRARFSGKDENLQRVFNGKDSLFGANPIMAGLLKGRSRLVFDGARYQLR